MGGKVEACVECTRKCLLIHKKKKNSSPVVTSFFKVMIGDQFSKLLEKESWDMNTPEKIEAASKKKEEGNLLFKAGKYAKASMPYEKAVKYIDYDSTFEEEDKKQAKALKVACNLNNAACKLKLRDYKEAEKLCTKVIELESRNVKALCRRAQAYIQLADLDLAEFDIKKALEIDPVGLCHLFFFASPKLLTVIGLVQNLTITVIKDPFNEAYGNDGWYFFESDSLKILVDALLEKQKKW